MPHRLAIFLGVLFLAGVCLLAWQSRSNSAPAVAEAEKKTARPQGPALPISQVILFSSGVGYYQREGEVQGNAQVQLSFPAGEINDLLKSLVLQDADKGKVGVITYDSHDPVDKTLRSI